MLGGELFSLLKHKPGKLLTRCHSTWPRPTIPLSPVEVPCRSSVMLQCNTPSIATHTYHFYWGRCAPQTTEFCISIFKPLQWFIIAFRMKSWILGAVSWCLPQRGPKLIFHSSPTCMQTGPLPVLQTCPSLTTTQWPRGKSMGLGISPLNPSFLTFARWPWVSYSNILNFSFLSPQMG